MSTKRRVLFLVPLVMLVLCGATSVAASTGTLTIQVKPAYVQFTLDGQKWENHYFYQEGHELVIQGVPTDKTVTLVVRSDGHRSQTLTLKPKRWRKKYDRKKKAYTLYHKTRVTLKKGLDPKPSPKK